MVKASEVMPMNGYVLIKPDEHYETYQAAGKETGILTTNFSYTDVQGKKALVNVKERNYSVRGTVVSKPMFLNVPDEKYVKMDRGVYTEGDHRGNIRDYGIVERFKKYNDTVSNYDTDIEILKGDRVFLSWKIHNEPMVIETDEGQLIFVKYSDIVMTVNDDNSPKKMINGWVLFTKMSDDSIENSDGISYKKSTTGLILPVMKDKDNFVKNKGICVLAGKPNRGYKDFPGYKDEVYHIHPGEKMLLSRNGIRNLEPLNHREYQEMYFITHRKYIIFTESTAKDYGLDFEKLS